MKFSHKVCCESAKIALAFTLISYGSSSVLAQIDLPPLPPGVTGPIAPPSVGVPYLSSVGIAPYPTRFIDVGGVEYAADQVIVKFKAGIAEELIQNLLRANGLEQKSHIRSIGARLLTFPGPVDVCFFIPLLQRSPLVEYAEMNGMGTIGGAPPVQDEYFSEQWNLRQIDITPVWEINRGGSFRIAILDSGVQSNHPDLADKIARNPYPDGSLMGYSAVTKSDTDPSSDDPASAYVAEDFNGHGTFVASIAAAKTTFPPLNGYAGSGIAGVNPYSQIVPVKVLNQRNRGTRMDGSYYNLAQGIDYATNATGVRVINASIYGYPYSQTVLTSIKKANDKNILFVTITGNTDGLGGYGSNYYGINDANGNQILHSFPGLYWRTMAVSATERDGGHAEYSESGSFNSVAAPGGKRDPDGNSVDSSLKIIGDALGGGRGYGWGTSFAAPHVSGLAALLLERYPTMSWESVQYRIEDTADDMNMGTFRGRDDQLGWGRINAYNATFPQTNLTKDFPASDWRLISLPV